VKGEVYSLFASAGERGVTPPEVRALEIWEVAAFFGVGLDRSGNDDPTASVVGKRFSEGGIDPNVLNRARRAMGQDAPDVELRSYHYRMGVL
jgi:hypothetical protein